MTHLVLDQFQEISPAGTVSPVGLKELRWTEAGSCVHLPGTCPLVTSAQGQDELCNWTGTTKAWMCLGESRVQVLLSGPRGYRCAWHICSQMNLAGQEVGKRLILYCEIWQLLKKQRLLKGQKWWLSYQESLFLLGYLCLCYLLSVCVGGKASVFSLTLPGHLSFCLGFPLYSIL